MRRHLFGAALVLLLTCAPALAQQTTGNITGRILDPQGAAVPGATVTAKNAATGFSRTDASDAEGVYRLTGLPPGDYDVTAVPDEFASEWQDPKVLEALAAQAQTVHLADGERKTLDLRTTTPR